MPTLVFQASSNIKDLIGRRLVTNKISALFELVKNSFDADAENVIVSFSDDGNTLVIEDDGNGMDLEDIRTKWMVIGTDNKRGQATTSTGRPINGEKGIGRFSADRLGKQLTLVASKGSQMEPVQMTFDWERFEEGGLLEQVPIEYSYIKEKRKTGLKLIISDLRDVWSRTEIESLEKRLRGLLSPFSNFESHSFKLVLDCKKYGYDRKVLEPYRLGDISSLSIELEISNKQPSIISYALYRNGAVVEEDSYNNSYSFGPVKLIVYFFDAGDKVSFRNKFGENVKDFGNIRIYRDFFQIYPYGETNNDWLDLEVRKTQGMFRHFGSRDLIGYIQIYREHNPQFIDATNRQGLEENQALQELRQLVKQDALSKLEEWFFIKRHKNSVKEHSQNREDITSATKNLREIAKDIKHISPGTAEKVVQLTKIIQETNQKQDKIIRDQQQVVEVYKRLSSKQTLLQSIIHNALIKAQTIETTMWNQRDDIAEFPDIPEALKIKLKESQDVLINISKQVTTYLKNAKDYLITKRERVPINIFQQLNKVFDNHKYDFAGNKIKYEIVGPTNLTLRFDINDFNVIFENLISNSMKSLKQIEDRQRMIRVTYSGDGMKTNIFFKDNGTGIDRTKITHIFNPFYSETEGWGMGLGIVDELVKYNGGEIQVVKPNGNESGATFQLTFDMR